MDLGRSGLLIRIPPPLSILIFCCLLHSSPSAEYYTWKLDDHSGKILPSDSFDLSNPPPTPPSNHHQQQQQPDLLKDQRVLYNILISTVLDSEGLWKKTSEKSSVCSNCIRDNRGLLGRNGGITGGGSDNSEGDDGLDKQVLDCGKSVNFTYYDHLVGIQNRHGHIHIPEPDVALNFKSMVKKMPKKQGSNGSGEISIDYIERKLKKFKRERPKSVELYNQIGNFWRIKGDTQKSIECFRRALAVSPNNAEILLNLARVLYNLQYLDDAIFLTRRSLEVQPPDQNAWLQHFQLGEILKAYCHYQEAALHLRHVLELKPNYGPALSALKDMESIPDSTVHVYTVLIIIFLVIAVILWIVSTLNMSFEELLGMSKAGASKSFKKFQVKRNNNR